MRFSAAILTMILVLTGCSTEHDTSTQADAEVSQAVATTERKNERYISINDGQFYRDGKPYYFVGVNYWYGPLIGAENGNRARLLQELDHMQANGISNLRVLVGSDAGIGSSVVKPALQNKQGEYDQQLLEGLDYFMAELGKRDMTAVLYLTNNWIWSGGMSQYLNWHTGEPVPNPFLPEHDWPDYMGYTARFHSCEACTDALQEHIRFIMGRTNNITGKPYAEDPAIMSWQVANEPRVFNNDNQQAFKAWLDDTVNLMTELSPNQLISTGSEGKAGSVENIDIWKDNHRNPNIDYLTIHVWPKNWSWYDLNDESGSLQTSIDKTMEYIQQHSAFAKETNRPITLEEFGFPRTGSSISPDTDTKNRDLYLTAILDALVTSAQQGNEFAGINPWSYGGFGKANPASEGIWQEGDDYLGDPAQEPQGLNTIFASDTSTIELLKSYADKLQAE